jgi:hypothetical protein
MKISVPALFIPALFSACTSAPAVTSFRNTTGESVAVTYESRRDGQARHVRIRGGGQVDLQSIRTFADLARLEVVADHKTVVVTARQFAGPLSRCAEQCLIRFMAGSSMNFSVPSDPTTWGHVFEVRRLPASPPSAVPSTPVA